VSVSKVENFSQNFDKNFDVSFSSTFFVLSHFRVFFSDGSSKTLQKKSCRKVSTKNSTKNPKPTFSRFFFYHVFGRFSVRGVQKHDKKYRKKFKSDPSPFSYSDPPTHHGGHRFLFYWRPLGKCTATGGAGGAFFLGPAYRVLDIYMYYVLWATKYKVPAGTPGQAPGTNTSANTHSVQLLAPSRWPCDGAI
jgi:hypothetical protein